VLLKQGVLDLVVPLTSSQLPLYMAGELTSNCSVMKPVLSQVVAVQVPFTSSHDPVQLTGHISGLWQVTVLVSLA